MKRAAFVVGMWLISASFALAQETGALWRQLDVATRLANDGRVEVMETHSVTFTGDVGVISRDFRLAADQKAVVHGVYRLEADGSKTPLTNAPVENAHCYQAYAWGLQFSVRSTKDPVFAQPTDLSYVIEYELVGALTLAWDLAGGPFPQGGTTSPRSPIERAWEVWAGWKEAWPDLGRRYRLDHDVAFPSINSAGPLGALNYNLAYDTAWVLPDKDRTFGVATPEVDYRVQRVLQYLPEGRPAAVTTQNAAFRLFAVAGPLGGGMALLALFLLFNRVLARLPPVDREIFEKRIGSAPPELISTWLAGGGRGPSLERILTRLAAQKKLAINVVTPETDDDAAVVQIRLTTSRDKLHPVDREVIGKLMGTQDSISTTDIQARYRNQGFDTFEVVESAIKNQGFKQTRYQKSRPGWTGVRLLFLLAAVGCAVKSLIERTTDDPIVLAAILVPGTVLGSMWWLGSATQRPSVLSLVIGVTALGVLGAAMAISPNTPLAGFAALGLGLAGLSHAALLLSNVPQSTERDLEFMAARAWGLDQLKRPHPALSDSWVDSIEAMGGKRALARWRSKYGGGQSGSAPDFSDAGSHDMPTGPRFTGEAPPEPVLEPDWSEGFSVYAGDDQD